METLPLRLVCVFAHPDDESLGAGGMLAKYSREGVETYLITATRGERGWQGAPAANPGLKPLGRVREAELRCAAKRLGVRAVQFLDYIDGDVDRADARQAIAKIALQLRQIQPHVVVTFGPEGVYGHPDHIAISQFTTAAVLAAAEANFPDASSLPPHRVAKLYYMVWTTRELAAYQKVFGKFGMTVDGAPRRAVGWQAWAITTRLDTRADALIAWQAVQCHQSQLAPHRARLDALTEQDYRVMWGAPSFYRALSLVNGGRTRETDLFQGLAPRQSFRT